MVERVPPRSAVHRKGTWQSRLEVLAAARQKVEREQRRLAQAAERRHRAEMALRDEEEEEETALRASAKLAKSGAKRVRTTPQRKPKNNLGEKRHRSPYHDEEGYLGLQLRCPHCNVLPIIDAAVDGGGNVACYDCLCEYREHRSPVTRLRRCLESTASGADSPFDDEDVHHQRDTTGWIRQPDKQAASSWGDLSDSDGEHDESPSTSAIDKLLEAANAGSEGDQPAQVTVMGQTGVRQDDIAAAALLFPGVSVVSVDQRQGRPLQTGVV
jgi:hypothetical protein